MLALVWQCCWEKAKGEAPWQGWGCSKLWAIVWKILRSNGEAYFCETINSAKAGWNAEVEGNGGRHTLPYLHGEGKGSKMVNSFFLILSFPLGLSKVGESAYLIRAQGLHWLLSTLSLVIRLFLLTPLLLLSASPPQSWRVLLCLWKCKVNEICMSCQGCCPLVCSAFVWKLLLAFSFLHSKYYCRDIVYCKNVIQSYVPLDYNK